jgi:hypothetical protein
LYFIAWTVGIGIVFYFGIKYQAHLKNEARMTAKMVPVLVFETIFPIIIGILLRVPKLIMEIREKRLWTYDWVKIVAVGLPTLYITFLPLLSFTTPFGMDLLFSYEILFLGDPVKTITTSGIIFGYVLLDSLKRKDSSKRSVVHEEKHTNSNGFKSSF